MGGRVCITVQGHGHGEGHKDDDGDGGGGDGGGGVWRHTVGTQTHHAMTHCHHTVKPHTNYSHTRLE